MIHFTAFAMGVPADPRNDPAELADPPVYCRACRMWIRTSHVNSHQLGRKHTRKAREKFMKLYPFLQKQEETKQKEM